MVTSCILVYKVYTVTVIDLLFSCHQKLVINLTFKSLSALEIPKAGRTLSKNTQHAIVYRDPRAHRHRASRTRSQIMTDKQQDGRRGGRRKQRLKQHRIDPLPIFPTSNHLPPRPPPPFGLVCGLAPPLQSCPTE